MPYAYTPRTYLVDPDAYGRNIDATWKPFTDDQRANVAAAYYQHRAACQTRRIAGEKGIPLDAVADAAGHTTNTLRRKLRGEAPARLDEILMWATSVNDITALPELSSLADLFPPTNATL